MSEAAAKLLEQVLALPEEERAFIVDRLTETLTDDGLEHDPAFEAELNRRLREVEEHPERLIDGEQVFREARERLQKRRQR